jgi:hypothetical protein
MQQPGPKLELAAERLGEDIGAWVRAHRDDDRSWAWIASKLAEKTRVQVSSETLRLFAQGAESGAK